MQASWQLNAESLKYATVNFQQPIDARELFWRASVKIKTRPVAARGGKVKRTAIVMLVCLVARLALAADPATSALTLYHSATLPGYTGDFDHFAADVSGGRLFLAAEDHGTVEVFDLKTGDHRRTLQGFETPHSLFLMPQQNRILVADGGKDVNMDKSLLAIVDPATGQHLGDIEFKSRHVEAMAIEQSGPRLFINITDQGKIAVVDRKTRAITAMWPVQPCGENSPVALDEANKRLFVVCRKPAMLVVFDTDTGKSIASLPAPARADDVAFDGVHHRIYVPGGEGYIAVYRQKDSNTYELMEKVPSAPGAKTCLLVSELNRLYVAVSPGDTKNEARMLTYDVHN